MAKSGIAKERLEKRKAKRDKGSSSKGGGASAMGWVGVGGNPATMSKAQRDFLQVRSGGGFEPSRLPAAARGFR